MADRSTRCSRIGLLCGMIAVGFAFAPTPAHADEKLAGRACRSVHLKYEAPKGVAYYNTVSVEKSAPGTYFCVCGFNQGYYGIQELGNGKKLVIFSVWDPGKQDDPKSVPQEKRVKLEYKDPAVRVGRFGGEGTGGQSFLDLDWKDGQTYRFLVTSRTEGERTAFSAYLATPEAPDWRHLVTFSTISGGKPLSGYYAFIEDFKRNKVSATQARSAWFGPGWVCDTASKGWSPLSLATFTADSNPSKAIDAGATGSRFRLATGGETANAHTPLRGKMTLPDPPSEKRPEGAFPNGL